MMRWCAAAAPTHFAPASLIYNEKTCAKTSREFSSAFYPHSKRSVCSVRQEDVCVCVCGVFNLGMFFKNGFEMKN